MFVMKIKERACIDYDFEVEIDDEDYRDFMAGIKTVGDLMSNYEEEIEDAREEVDFNEWGATHGDAEIEIIEE